MRPIDVLIAAQAPVFLWIFGEKWLGFPDVPVAYLLGLSLTFTGGYWVGVRSREAV